MPVVDLSPRFGRSRTEMSRRTCIVIIEEESGDESKQDIGVVVDSVAEVPEIPRSEIEPPPVFGARIRADFMLTLRRQLLDLRDLLQAAQVLEVH